MAQELASANTQTHTSSPGQFKWLQFTQQSTEPIEPIVTPTSEVHTPGLSPTPRTKRPYLRYVALGVVLALAAAMYVVWHASQAPGPAVSMAQQSFTGSGSTRSAPLSQTADTTHPGGEIQVYVIGAVQHPGVYNLPAGARVYQLLQAAGGALPSANLVALNLAARLNDGQEIYVLRIGETPPTFVGGTTGSTTTTNTGSTTGQPVNINTATADELRQSLHISAKTAQNIINYRLQHGPYSAVSELQNVVSRAIYNRIKDQVTV